MLQKISEQIVKVGQRPEIETDKKTNIYYSMLLLICYSWRIVDQSQLVFFFFFSFLIRYIFTAANGACVMWTKVNLKALVMRAEDSANKKSLNFLFSFSLLGLINSTICFVYFLEEEEEEDSTQLSVMNEVKKKKKKNFAVVWPRHHLFCCREKQQNPSPNRKHMQRSKY